MQNDFLIDMNWPNHDQINMYKLFPMYHFELKKDFL